jgi:uncharacterized protein YggL (DUF469 family)
LKRRARCKKRRFVRAVAVSEVQGVGLQVQIVLLEDSHDETVNQHVESVIKNALLEDTNVLFRQHEATAPRVLNAISTAVH